MRRFDKEARVWVIDEIDDLWVKAKYSWQLDLSEERDISPGLWENMRKHYDSLPGILKFRIAGEFYRVAGKAVYHADSDTPHFTQKYVQEVMAAWEPPDFSPDTPTRWALRMGAANIPMGTECSCSWCAGTRAEILRAEEVEDWALPATPALEARCALAQYLSKPHTFDASKHLAETSDPEVGESWPKDNLHDAAKQVVRGAKHLTPTARQAVAGAVEKASAPPTGREAADGALGRALGSRHTSYGLRTGA